MKLRAIVLAAGVLTLSACGSKEGDAAASGEQAAPPAAAAPSATAAPAAPASGSAPTKEFMVGKWAEGGECEMAIDFKADGTMDGPVERWELADGKLTMVGMPQKMHLTVIDPDTMESRLDGTEAPRKLLRCK